MSYLGVFSNLKKNCDAQEACANYSYLRMCILCTVSIATEQNCPNHWVNKAEMYGSGCYQRGPYKILNCLQHSKKCFLLMMSMFLLVYFFVFAMFWLFYYSLHFLWIFNFDPVPIEVGIKQQFLFCWFETVINLFRIGWSMPHIFLKIFSKKMKLLLHIVPYVYFFLELSIYMTEVRTY